MLADIEDSALHEFVADWDALEALAIEVFRAGQADAEQEGAFTKVGTRLRAQYPQWKEALEAHWRATSIQGKPLIEDPFDTLIALPDAAAMVGNWAAMQTLPAAREALNGMLMARIEDGA